MNFAEAAANALRVLRNEKLEYLDYLPNEAIKVGSALVLQTNGLWEDVLAKVVAMVHEELPFAYPYPAVWWYSVLIGMQKNEALFLEFVRYVREHQQAFSVNTRYFIFYQMKSLLFRFDKLDGEAQKELWLFYQEIVEDYAKAMPRELLTPIPLSERKKDVVVVITEQFIATEHGPTKTALDRCKTLIDVMGKEVLLINDAEVLSQVGNIPFWGAMGGNYDPKREKETCQEWKGVKIPYYQCEKHMPNFAEVQHLLEQIRQIAPERIIAIGGAVFWQIWQRVSCRAFL